MTLKRKAENFMEILFRMFLLIGGFTAIDIIYHYFYEQNFNLYQVPMSYYLNKIVIGFALAVLAYYIVNYMFRKYSYRKMSVFSLIIVGILQIRYYTTGHFTPFQNIVMFSAHYVMLIAIMTTYYKIYDMDFLG